MVAELRLGNPLLFERIFLRHFETGLTYLVQNDGAPYDQAYDSMMEALLHFRARLVAGKIRYGNLRYLLTRMARQEYLRRFRQDQYLSTVPEGMDPAAPPGDNIPEEEFDLLDRAFNSLGSECKSLLRDFYYNHRSLKEIAESEERTAVAVRKQKSRCVEKLKKYYILFTGQ